MLKAIKNFFIDGIEELNEVIIKPFSKLSFYKKSFLIILAGLLLYIPYLTGFNATHDEKYTLLMCRFDILKMIKIIAIEDGHPPLSYLYAKFWIWLFGADIHHIIALRVATLFTFFLTALIGVFPLKRLLGEKAALCWIILIFILPSSFYLAINMRMYPLAVFAIGGEFTYAMLFVYKPKKYDLLRFVAFTLFALYTHYYCVILSAVIWLTVFIDFINLKEYKKILKLIGAGIFVSLIYTPWLFAYTLQYQNMKNLWFIKKQYSSWAIEGALFAYTNFLEIYHKICLLLGVFCWILSFEFLLDTKKDNFEHIIAKRALLTFWSIYIIAFILSIVMRPTLLAAYMIVPVSLFYIVIALSVMHFKKFRPLFYIFTFAAFIIGYTETYAKVQDKEYIRLQSYIREDLPPNSIVLYRYSLDHLLMMFSGPNIDIYYTPAHKHIILFQDAVQKESKHLQNIDKYDHFYTLTSMYDPLEYSRCTAQFTTAYDQISYCFTEIPQQEALRIIKRTTPTLQGSFHKRSLRL